MHRYGIVGFNVPIDTLDHFICYSSLQSHNPTNSVTALKDDG